MRKVLVAGGLGFIGFHLCERLLLEGVEVIAVDPMPPHKKEVQEEMILRIGRNSLLTIIEERIEHVLSSPQLKEVDVIFHLASLTSVQNDWSNMGKVIENQVNVTRRLVEAMPANARLIYASSIEVYGERCGIVTEKTPTNPRSLEGIAKLANEEMIKKLCVQKGVPYIIVRLPTIYGPWQRDDMTYQQILLGAKQPIRDGSTIDVLYVDDVIDAFLLAAKTKSINETFHLSSKRDAAWYEGLQLLGYEGELTHKGKLTTSLSAEKAEQLLGFHAKTPLEKGLLKQREHLAEWKRLQTENMKFSEGILGKPEKN